jgi:hypothetical protein
VITSDYHQAGFLSPFASRTIQYFFLLGTNSEETRRVVRNFSPTHWKQEVLLMLMGEGSPPGAEEGFNRKA